MLCGEIGLFFKERILERRMRVYVSKSNVNCGPCSFINLTGIKANKNTEFELSEIGRLKPFHASTYSAFLVWAKKFKKDLLVFTSSKKINKKMLRLMNFYEKVPKEKQNEFKIKAEKLLSFRNKKFENKIQILKSAIRKLDQLLSQNYKVAFLTSDSYLNEKRKPVPHWIVAYAKKGDYYYFMDSAKSNGRTILTKKELAKGLKINKSQGFMPQLVAHKK